MKLNLHLPINSTSFGQTSTLILRTLFDEIKAGKRNDEDFSVFALGQVDTKTQDLPQDFSSWLGVKIQSSLEKHDRKTPTFKLWHLNGGMESLSEKQTLLSFYELDQPTEAELNAVRNNNTLFSSSYTIENFEKAKAKSSLLPLAFDDYNFKNTGKTYFGDGRVVFNLCGKFEKRKNHEKVIQSWIKRFKNDRKYFLQCAVYNPFINPEGNNNIISNVLKGDKPFNTSFIPFLDKNSHYNDFLNSADIVLGMSGGEGWGLPEFSSSCLGKHSVILNAHGYKDWVGHAGSEMVEPSSKSEAYDGVFFHKGAPFNQGSIFDFNEDQFIDACEQAVLRVKNNKVNENAKQLKALFSKVKLLDNIIKYAS